MRHSLQAAFATTFIFAASLANALPDLTVSSISRDNVTNDTQTLEVGGTLNIDVENVTNDAAGAFRVTAFEDENLNGVYDPGTDEILGTMDVAGLAGMQILSTVIPIAGTAKFRDALIYAVADLEDAIAEEDETNNSLDTSSLSQFEPPPGAFDPVIEWSWDGSTVEPTFRQVIVTPIVANLTDDNGDGLIDVTDTPDVLFQTSNRLDGSLCSGGGILRAVSGADGSPVFDITDPGLRVLPCDPVAVGDLDGDGLVEIVAAQLDRLVIFENDGTFKAFSDPVSSQFIVGGPSIADIDRDGTPEIIAGATVLDNNGNLLFSNFDRGNGNFGALSTVADLDLAGDMEIVAGFRAYNSDGSVFYNAGNVGGYPAIGNFDADDNPEVVVVANGSVYLLEHTGAVNWGPVAIPGGGLGGPPTVADFDNDGQPEIGVAGSSRYAVFDTDGSLLWSSVTRDFSSNITGSSVFDFEGDGSAEVVYHDELFLRVYRGTDGAVLFQTPNSTCTATEYPAIVDVDNDGNAEIVVSRNQICGFGPQVGIAVFGDLNDTWVPTRRIWNQHAYHITNVNEDGSIPQDAENNWQVEGLNNFRLNAFAPDEGRANDAPDLTTSAIRCEADEAVARIGNGGSVQVAAGVGVGVYDGDPDAGGTLLGSTATSVALGSDEFEDVALPGDPDALPAVWVAVDPDNLDNEGFEDNNVATAALPECRIVCIENLAVRVKRGKAQLTWTHVPGSTYEVQRAASETGPYTTIAVTDSTYSTYLDTGAPANAESSWRVVRIAQDLPGGRCESQPVSAFVPRSRR